MYLINNMNANGSLYNDLNDLYEFIGTGMYLQSSVAGKKASDIIDNVEAQAINHKWFGMPTVFSSFGLSELVYPSAWFSELYTYGIAADVLHGAFSGRDGSDKNNHANFFIESAKMNEHGADDVINDILKPGDFKKFPLPPQFSKEVIATTFGKKDQYLNEIQSSLLELAKDNVEKQKQNKLVLLRKEIDLLLSKPKGIETVKEFINDLIGRFVEFKNEMIDEKTKLQRNKEDLAGHYNRLRIESGNAAKALFNTKSKIELVMKEFKQVVEKEAGINLEIERRERAIELFSAISNELLSTSDRLKAFSSYCDELSREFSQKIQRLKSEKARVKPFVHELIPAGLTQEIPIVNPQEILDWLINNNIEPIEFVGMNKSDLKELFLRFGKENISVKEIENKSLEEILKAMPEAETMKYINLLDMMAAPLWQYDRGYISGTMKTTNLYIFGVENPNDSILDPVKIMSHISSTQLPDIIATGDKTHIICLKVETAIPAFALKNMVKYKEKYDNPDAAFPYHIHKDWDKIIPDLFPESDEEGIRKYWSLGLATPFKIISKTGEYYYVASEKLGEGVGSHRRFKLAQGRKESMKVFINNKDLIDEVAEGIERKMKSMGNESIVKDLLDYGKDLEEKAANSTKEIRLQIDNELKDIEQFLKSIGDIL